MRCPCLPLLRRLPLSQSVRSCIRRCDALFQQPPRQRIRAPSLKCASVLWCFCNLDGRCPQAATDWLLLLPANRRRLRPRQQSSDQRQPQQKQPPPHRTVGRSLERWAISLTNIASTGAIHAWPGPTRCTSCSGSAHPHKHTTRPTKAHTAHKH